MPTKHFPNGSLLRRIQLQLTRERCDDGVGIHHPIALHFSAVPSANRETEHECQDSDGSDESDNARGRAHGDP
jgi:hypothetical protein